MKLDRNTYGTVLLVYLFSAVAIILLLIFAQAWWIKWPLVLVLIWFSGWQTVFHMVPNRHKVGNGNVVSSVSDGKVVIIKKTIQKEFLDRECIQVSVYMDFWDVHANFWPVSGKINYWCYHPGKHLLAFKPKASEDNEHSCVCIRTEEGKDVMFKQLAGTFARRIVCYAQEGMETKAGEQCGIIKFGSRIDYFLPLDAEIKVKLGDLVRACESVIAVI